MMLRFRARTDATNSGIVHGIYRGDGELFDLRLSLILSQKVSPFILLRK